MYDGIKQSKKHEIEGTLFHISNLAKVFNLIGKKRQIEITKGLLKSNLTDRETWNEIIEYLDIELKVKEQILLFEKSTIDKCDNRKGKHLHDVPKSYSNIPSSNKKCFLCDKTDHVATVTRRGNLVINHFACEKLAKMSPNERYAELKRNKLCFQCLTPGLKAYHEGKCFDMFKCPHEDHKRF